MGFDQARMGNKRQPFPWFGMLYFIEQNRRHQHRIDAMPCRFTEDGWLEGLETVKGSQPQGLQLIHPIGEELGQRCLGAMHAETPLEDLQFLNAEIGRIEIPFQRGLRLAWLHVDAWRSAEEAQSDNYGSTGSCSDKAQTIRH